MIALDTNVLIRLITHDDPKQAAAAVALLKKDGPFFVGHLVLAETVWTLRRLYGFSADEVGTVLSDLLDRRDIVFESDEAVRAGLRVMGKGGVFADALIVAKAREFDCASLATFDSDLAGRNPGYAVRLK